MARRALAAESPAVLKIGISSSASDIVEKKPESWTLTENYDLGNTARDISSILPRRLLTCLHAFSRPSARVSYSAAPLRVSYEPVGSFAGMRPETRAKCAPARSS